MQGRVAPEDAHQSEGGAGGTEGEVEALVGVGGVAQKNQQHRGHYGVNGQQDNSADNSVAVQREGLGVRQRGLQRRYAEKDDGVNERDDGALPAIQDGERVHDLLLHSSMHGSEKPSSD